MIRYLLPCIFLQLVLFGQITFSKPTQLNSSGHNATPIGLVMNDPGLAILLGTTIVEPNGDKGQRIFIWEHLAHGAWGNPLIIEDASITATIAINNHNYALATWQTTSNSIVVSIRLPSGKWQTPITIRSSTEASLAITASLNDQGNAIISWSEKIGGSAKDINTYVSSTTSILTNSWTSPYLLSTDHYAAPKEVSFSTTVLNEDGIALLSHAKDNQNIYVYQSDIINNTSWSQTALGTFSTVHNIITPIVIGNNDQNVVLFWTDDTNVYATENDSWGSGSWTPTSLVTNSSWSKTLAAGAMDQNGNTVLGFSALPTLSPNNIYASTKNAASSTWGIPTNVSQTSSLVNIINSVALSDTPLPLPGFAAFNNNIAALTWISGSLLDGSSSVYIGLNIDGQWNNPISIQHTSQPLQVFFPLIAKNKNEILVVWSLVHPASSPGSLTNSLVFASQSVSAANLYRFVNTYSNVKRQK